MNIIQTLKSFLKKHKKSILMVFIVYIFVLIFLIPYNDIIQKVVLKTIQAYPEIDIKYQSSSVGFLPPRLTFEQAEIKTQWIPQSISFDKFTLKPSYLALLALNLGANIEVEKEQSQLKLWLRQSTLNKKPIFLIQLTSNYFDVRYLNLVSSFFNEAKGVIEVFIDLELDPSFTRLPDGLVQLEGTNLEFQPYSIANFNLPLLKWSSVKTKFKTSKGTIDIDHMLLGTNRDSIFVDANGEINVSLRPLALQTYNMDLNLIADRSFTEQFSLDTILGNVEDKLSENRSQYLVNIQGRSLYPPKITPIESKNN